MSNDFSVFFFSFDLSHLDNALLSAIKTTIVLGIGNVVQLGVAKYVAILAKDAISIVNMVYNVKLWMDTHSVFQSKTTYT